MKNCKSVKTIEDVNNQYDFAKEHPGGKFIQMKLTCGQSEKVNELYDIYRKHYFNYEEDEVAEAMCECCRELKPKGNETVPWSVFYYAMAQKGFKREESA